MGFFEVFAKVSSGAICREAHEAHGATTWTAAATANSLNTEYHEWDTYIAPDESYMIYCTMMPGGLGSDDLYVTFETNDGSWSKAVHLGNQINTEKSENRPYVSPDGMYLFYTSTIRGNRDIYWVDAKIIQELNQNG